jgi:hypothetical protein
MNYLQIVTNVDYHRDRLLREAEAERLANRLRSATTRIGDEPERQPRRGTLSILWRRLAAQTA